MGYNLKPLDLQGAIGLKQIDKLDEILDKRKNSHNKITDIFEKNIPDIKIPKELELSQTAWFGTPFICKTKKQKQQLIRHLENNKIQTRNFFAGNILVHPGYSFLGNYMEYPKANIIYDRVFFVGASPHYDQRVFDYMDNVLTSTI